MLRAEFDQTMDPNGVHFTADYFLPANSQECQGRRHATLAQRPADDLRIGAVVMGGSPAAGFQGRFRRAKARIIAQLSSSTEGDAA